MSEQRINITCETCKKTHNVERTDEIPTHVISMGCNWCPECEDMAEDYYEEWYNEDEGGEPIPEVPNNQLFLPFIIEEIDSKTIELTHER